MIDRRSRNNNEQDYLIRLLPVKQLARKPRTLPKTASNAKAMLAQDCCPQCGREVDSIGVRLVQDSCGHKKCRPCLLSEESGCSSCSCSEPQYTDLKPVQSSVPHELCNVNNDTLDPVLSSENVSLSSISPAPLQVNQSCQPGAATLTPVSGQSSPLVNAESIDDDCTAQSADETSKAEKKRPMLGLKEHIVFTPGDPPKYFCKHCKKSYNNRKAARYHNYCGAPNSEKPHTCEICGQGFVTKGHFAYHMKSHTGSLPFICKTCGKGFKQLSKLNRHSKSHEDKLEKPFQCSLCKRAFSTKHILKDHMLSHSEGLSLPCPICNKKLSSKSCLRKHKKLHSEPTHKCNHCGKKFSVKWSLEVHQRSHLRERKFKCRLCNRAFKLKSDLTRHAVVHQEDGEWDCKICDLVFRRRDNLVRHVKNIHPESSLKISVNQGKVKDIDVTEESPKTDVNLSNTSASVSNAVSVIRGCAVPVIQKAQSAVANELTQPLENSFPEEIEDQVNAWNNNLIASQDTTSPQGMKQIRLPLSNDQNYHRESVVCHSDSRGIVHYASSSFESHSDLNFVKARSLDPEPGISKYEEQFHVSLGNTSAVEVETCNSSMEIIQRPRVIVAKEPICDNS